MVVNPVRPAALTALSIVLFCLSGSAHDLITTNITFDKEIIRIIHSRCARCHREGAAAFSLMTYKEARPWAQAIKEEILSRRMSPWGAVKGFGEFRNDEALSNEQIETILGWIDGGAPEGEEATLPQAPPPAPATVVPKPQLIVGGPPVGKSYVVSKPIKLDGIVPVAIPKGASARITVTLPDGSVEPLVWLDAYQDKFPHPFLLEKPLNIPAGSRIDGIPPGAKLGLLFVR